MPAAADFQSQATLGRATEPITIELMPEPIAFLNGQFVPAAQAVIPATDTGFVLGTTVSEQLRTFRGKLFRVAEHWDRLARSLEIIGVTPPFSLPELAFTAEQVALHNFALLEPGDDLGMVVAITPGSFAAFARVADYGPTVLIHTFPLPFGRWGSAYSAGVRLRITPTRQVPASSWPPELKCRSRMHYYLADRWANAQEPGARALLLNERGEVNETSSANVIAVLGQRLISPPLNEILPGISLEVVRELAAKLGWPFDERRLSPDELFAAEEVLLTSTPFGVLAVTAIDGRAIGAGRPGTVFGETLSAWSALVGVDIAAQAVRRGG